MVYLPKGYEKDKNKKWPLIVFLHGSGDRGNNIHLLAKASPYMYIREQEDLPFIIVAPLLAYTPYYRSFPVKYIDDFLTKIISDYRVDSDSVYFTGLSMGGEATYRYGINHPDRVAAISPLCPPLLIDKSDLYIKSQGWEFIDKPLTDLINMPIWTIGGGKDLYVPVEHVRKVADAIKKAGGNIKLTILEENGHDVWTETYSDRAFYDWFLQYKRNK
jgi:predicted peptidase